MTNIYVCSFREDIFKKKKETLIENRQNNKNKQYSLLTCIIYSLIMISCKIVGNEIYKPKIVSAMTFELI